MRIYEHNLIRRVRWLGCLAIALFAASMPGVGAAADTAGLASVLKKVEAAGSAYSYKATGTTRVQYKGRVISSEIRFFHSKPDMCRIEYSSPPLDGVVVGMCRERSWRMDPKLGKVVVSESTDCAAVPARLGLLLRSHRVKVTAGEKVAGRPTTQLELKSRLGVVRKRLWVDDKTFVVLRSEDYSARGRLLSSTVFKSIEFTGSLPSSLFKCPAAASGAKSSQLRMKEMSYPVLCKAVGFEVSKPGYIPKGYKLDGYRLYTCPRSSVKSAFTRYSNGLDAISIFETLKDRDCYGRGGCCARHGGRGFMLREAGPGQMLVLNKRDRTLVIIADINRQELRRLTRSLK